jgi:anti-sigma B factor antagonist
MDVLGVAVSNRDGCQIVKASGDLDGDTAPGLESALDTLVRHMPVIIDLTGVRTLTSAGVQALLRERAFGLPTLLCPDGTTVARVLEIVQAHRLVPIYADLQAALISLTA